MATNVALAIVGKAAVAAAMFPVVAIRDFVLAVPPIVRARSAAAMAVAVVVESVARDRFVATMANAAPANPPAMVANAATMGAAGAVAPVGSPKSACGAYAKPVIWGIPAPPHKIVKTAPASISRVLPSPPATVQRSAPPKPIALALVVVAWSWTMANNSAGCPLCVRAAPILRPRIIFVVFGNAARIAVAPVVAVAAPMRGAVPMVIASVAPPIVPGGSVVPMGVGGVAASVPPMNIAATRGNAFASPIVKPPNVVRIDAVEVAASAPAATLVPPAPPQPRGNALWSNK